MTLTRQQRRQAERKIAKARAALGEPGEAREQAVAEKRRAMGERTLPRKVRLRMSAANRKFKAN